MLYFLSIIPILFIFPTLIYGSICEEKLTQTNRIRPIFFAMEKAGIKSYVMGVLHQTVSGENLPADIYTALQQTQSLVREVDPEEPFPMDLIFSVDTPLATLLSVPAQERLRELFPHLPPLVLPVMPYMQYIELTLGKAIKQELPEGLGSSATARPAATIEGELSAFAINHGKKISFLEGQRNVISRFVDAISPALLEWTLLHLNTNELVQAFFQQRAAFLAGNLEEHADLYFQAHVATQTTDLYEKLIVERNHHWVEKIMEMHTQGPIFLLVGVGHLGGEESLLKLLTGQGFKITKLVATGH